MSEKYIKDISRIGYSFYDIKRWYEGELRGLGELINFGFENTFFLVEGGNVTSYYDLAECEKFYKNLDKTITEEFFNKMCDSFFELIEESKKTDNPEEIFNLMVALWARGAIFHELSNCPEYANDSMLRRLFRIRKSTESFSYDFSKKLNKEIVLPKNYIFFKGKVFEKSFDSFIEENNFILENG
jgi:hypothetical protein